MAWVINGNLFTGTILTVGVSGCDYTDLGVAIMAASTGTLILVYGSVPLYTSTWPSVAELFIRGMGDTPTDTVVTCQSPGEQGISLFGGSTFSSMIIENLKMTQNTTWGKDFLIWNTTGSLIANKCYFHAPTNIYNFGGKWFDPNARGNIANVLLQNCTIVRGYAHFCYLNLNYFSLRKVETNGSINNYNTIGTFAINDSKTTPTSGYGYDYGEYLITEIPDTPTITSFSPSSGFVGDEVTITGTGFGGTTSIKLYDEKVATVKSYTSTELTFYVPEDAETGCIYVSNDGIEWIISDTYFYVRQPVAITSVTPTICYIGDEVIIDGENFTGETTVTFYNGVSATIDSYTDTQIITHVPSGAISGNVTISDSGYSDTINISLYDLSILSFSPSSGHVGDVITITGTGITGSVNVLFYNNIPATINSFTNTQIITTAPLLAETGPITITHALLSDSSSNSFLILDRYWIGGSGNWNDISHWSTSSGGPSGAAVPTSASTVIFDENSFTMDGLTVSLSTDCYCKTFDCSAIDDLVTFDFVSAAYLNVYEDIILSSNVSFTYPTLTDDEIINREFPFGIIISQPCNLISNGIKLPPVTTSSSIILQDDITCENLLISGSLNSQGYKINSRGVTFQPLLSEIFIDINNSDISCYIFQIDDTNDKLTGNLLANITIEEQT